MNALIDSFMYSYLILHFCYIMLLVKATTDASALLSPELARELVVEYSRGLILPNVIFIVTCILLLSIKIIINRIEYIHPFLGNEHQKKNRSFSDWFSFKSKIIFYIINLLIGIIFLIILISWYFYTSEIAADQITKWEIYYNFIRLGIDAAFIGCPIILTLNLIEKELYLEKIGSEKENLPSKSTMLKEIFAIFHSKNKSVDKKSKKFNVLGWVCLVLASVFIILYPLDIVLVYFYAEYNLIYSLMFQKLIFSPFLYLSIGFFIPAIILSRLYKKSAS